MNYKDKTTMRISPEKKQLKLGFIPLTDCAPLVVAKEKGFFEASGLDVELKREASWANIRDKVIVGELDAAQMLSPMPLAISAGIGSVTKAMLAPIVLDLNGNAITISNQLKQALASEDAKHIQSSEHSAHVLKQLIEQEKKDGLPRRTFATVYPYSMHTLQLRYWLDSVGIKANEDVRIVVIPPSQMVANLRKGHIDGFCAGEPWNTLAVHEVEGHIAVTGYDIWNNSPEKVLGVTQEWADLYPDTLNALIHSLYCTCAWLDKQENRLEAAQILADPEYVDAPVEVISASLSGSLVMSPGASPKTMNDFHVFHRYAANYPWRSHALWILQELYRDELLTEDLDRDKLAQSVFNEERYCNVLEFIGESVPKSRCKTEGRHPDSWIDKASGILMGSDIFFNGKTFDPEC